MHIRPAAPEDAPALTRIAYAAKRHWGYDAAAMALWQEALSMTPERLAALAVWVAEESGERAGFSAVAQTPSGWVLDDLWVLPERMGRGIGSALLRQAIAHAAAGGACELAIDAEPFAESFYLRHGARRAGVVAAPIPGRPERVRPQLLLPVVCSRGGD